ncbi:hypothetical protein [Fundidesulfovibrio butyratiphilus]
MSDHRTIEEARADRSCDRCPHRARFGQGECLHPRRDESNTCPGQEVPDEE